MAEKAPAKASKAKAPTKNNKAIIEGDKPIESTKAPEPLMINGVPVANGDTKGGGSAKKQLVTMVATKSVHIVKGFNPRMNIADSEVELLAENIKKDGLLTALLVRPAAKDGNFDLISGEKRLRALQLLGWEEVAVMVRQDLVGDDATAKAIATAENSDDLRKPLNAIEIGRVCKELEDGGWTINTIAKGVGHSEQKVRRCLNIITAPMDVQKRVLAGTMSMITALEVAKMDDATRAKLGDSLKGDLSAAEVRRLAKEASKGDPDNAVDGKPANKKTGTARDAALTAWRPNRVKQQAIVDMAYNLSQANAEDLTTADYYEMRGAMSAMLWDRGDLDSNLLPAVEATDPKEIKINKQFMALVAAEAKKKKVDPVAAEEGAEGTAATEGGEALEPTATGTGKHTKKAKSESKG